MQDRYTTKLSYTLWMRSSYFSWTVKRTIIQEIIDLYSTGQLLCMCSDLDSFFNPRSIAVIGASRNPRKFGHIIFRNLVGKKVYPVNPGAEEILGKKSYKSVLDIKSPVDLAVIAVPAANVVQAVAECSRKDVKACIIITSGFAEAGNAAGEEAIKKVAGGMRIVGPNVI